MIGKNAGCFKMLYEWGVQGPHVKMGYLCKREIHVAEMKTVHAYAKY